MTVQSTTNAKRARSAWGVVTSALRSMMRPSGGPARNPHSVAVEFAYAGEISQRDLPPPPKSISRKARAYLARRGAEPYLSPPPLDDLQAWKLRIKDYNQKFAQM